MGSPIQKAGGPSGAKGGSGPLEDAQLSLPKQVGSSAASAYEHGTPGSSPFKYTLAPGAFQVAFRPLD